MKKYPVHYKGKEYEVRWKEDRWGHHVINTTLCIYEVKRFSIFKIRKAVFNIDKDAIAMELLNKKIFTDNPYHYIEEIKLLFQLWEETKNRYSKEEFVQQLQERALANWDGVIEGGE